MRGAKFFEAVGGFFAAIGRGLARFFKAIGRGLGVCFGWLGRGISAVFIAIWRAIVFVFSAIGRGFAAVGRWLAGLFGRPSYGSRRSYGSSSHGLKAPNGWEIAAIIILVILTVLSATRSTEAIIEWLNALVSDVFPGLYEFSLPRLVLDWMESEIDVFFLLIPLIWILQLICLILSFVCQLVLWILIAIGHLLALILSIVGQVVLIYLLAPALSVLLIVKRARGEDISVFSIVLSVVLTLLYYLLWALPPLV